nr:MAG TPA: putative endoribonuclease [Caudoviricetes sp.]
MPRRKHIGDIWKVPYTYDDNPGKYKWRPIVIVGLRKKENTVVGLKCSTKGDDDKLLDKTRSIVDDIDNASNQNEYKYAYELIDPPSGMNESNRVICNKEIEVKNFNRNFKYIGTLKNKLDIDNILLMYDEADRNNDIIKVNRESFFVNESAVYDDSGIVLSNMEEFEEDTDKGKYIFAVDASNIEYIKSVLPDRYPDNIKYINLDKIINYLFYNTWVDITDEDDITDKMTDEYFARVYPNVDRKDIFSKTNTEDLNLNMTIEEVYIEMTKILRFFMYNLRGENRTIFILDKSLYTYLVDQYPNLVNYSTMYFGSMAIALYKTYSKEIPQEYDIIRRLSDLKEYATREHMSIGAVGGIIGTMDGNMMVQYGMHPNSFTGEKDGLGIVEDKKKTKLRVKEDNEKTEIVDKEPFLQDKFYMSYRHKKDRVTWENAVNLYEEITGKVMLSKDQLAYDDDFEEVNLDKENKLPLLNAIYTLESEIYDDSLPIVDMMDLQVAKLKLREFPEGTAIMEDPKGYFAVDHSTGIRTKPYKSILEIEAPAFVKAKEMLTRDDDTQSTNNKKAREVNASGLYKVLDDKYSSEEQLMDDWNDYNSLSSDMKRHSDDMSIEIYGKSNVDRFKELRNKYLNSEIPYNDLALSESALRLSDLDRARDYGIELRGKKREIEYLKDWSLNSGIYIILPCDTEEELNAQWNNLQSMDISLIRISDARLMEVFGCNNETMYNFLKSVFTNNGFDDFYYIPMIESAYTFDPLKVVELPSDSPFFIPHEIEVFKRNSTFGSIPEKWKAKADQWLRDYKKIYEGKSYDKRVVSEWVQTIRELSYRYKQNPTDELKQALLEFGWSPYMEFNDSNRVKAHNRSNTLCHRSMTRRLLNEKGIGFEFNRKGDLFINNFLKKKDYQSQYMEAHRLLVEYDKSNNIDGMKYELAKLYFLATKIQEDLIVAKRDKTNTKKLTDIRARVLNDFHKYIKVVLKSDKHFNFSNYYQRSEFSDDSIVIKSPTLKYTGKYAKDILRML